MCREDIRMGRKTYVAARVVSCPNGVSTPLCGANKNRVSLSIFAGTNGALVGPDEITVSATSGIAITQNGIGLKLSIHEQGQLVCRPWNGAGNGVAANVVVIEGFFDDGEYP